MVWMGIIRSGAIFWSNFAERNLDNPRYLRIVHYDVIQRDFYRKKRSRKDVVATRWCICTHKSPHNTITEVSFLVGSWVRMATGLGLLVPRTWFSAISFFGVSWSIRLVTLLDQQPQNLDELRATITRTAQPNPYDPRCSSWNEMTTRCRSCIAEVGRTFPHE